MEGKYKKILEEKIKGLEDEVDRQAEESKAEKGTLGSKVMQYANDTGITEKAVKVGVVTGVAYAAGIFLPIVTGPFLAGAALLGYGGKKFIYDPFFKRKKK